MFQREAGTLNFSLVKKMKDAHSRIIWGISWSHDDKLFATCSREKQKAVKIWYGSDSDGEIGNLHSELPANTASASTAISFFPSNFGNTRHLMIGLETGALMVWKLGEGLQWTKCLDIAPYYAHTL